MSKSVPEINKPWPNHGPRSYHLPGRDGPSPQPDLRAICELADLYWDKSRCTGCGHCLSFCPRGVFRRDGDSGIRLCGWLCLPCGKCLGACPEEAIGFKGS